MSDPHLHLTHDTPDWIRAFLDLRDAAARGRGSITIVDDHDVESGRWPRTTGRDAIAIGALLDPIVMAALGTNLTQGARAWDALNVQLVDAIADDLAAFRGNEILWSTLAVVATELHMRGAPLPAARQWAALLAQLATPNPPRNADPSKLPKLTASSFANLYDQQFQYFRALRGVDELEAEQGMTGASRAIPRTTIDDVIALFDFWDPLFQKVTEHPTQAGKKEYLLRWWNPLRAEIDANRPLASREVYFAHNNGFWRAMREVALFVSAAVEADRSAFAEILDSLSWSVRHLPETLGQAAHVSAAAVSGLFSSVASGLGKGFFGPLKLPLAIGAGAVGLYLLTRRSSHEYGEG